MPLGPAEVRVDTGCFVQLDPSKQVCTMAGISLKTQEMYGLVFLTRYIDIFFRFISL